MPSRGTFRFVAVFAPLMLFGLAVTSPYYSERLRLILHGRPFAWVAPKESVENPIVWTGEYLTNQRNGA